ncbi:hypothetical protein GB937_008870 [Aspergillus fischeri]|nr:hypothetical protein GB937_008870 [Aspergillus fischeri]
MHQKKVGCEEKWPFGRNGRSAVDYPSDQLRLATAVIQARSEVTYISQSSDTQQQVEDLLSEWYRTGSTNSLSLIYVVIVRESQSSQAISDPLPTQPDEKPERKKIKKEPKQRSKVKTEPTPEIKSELAVRQPTKKRSFSVANTEIKTEEEDIITSAIQEYDEILASVGVRTRNQGPIKQEDLDRIAEFGR